MIDKRAGAASQGADHNPFDFDAFPVGDQSTANRPANNAQRATPAGARAQAQSWQTQQGAQDFLGLDQELSRGAQAPQFNAPAGANVPPPPNVAAAQQPPPVQREADESWLMEMTEDRSVARAEPQPMAESSSAAVLRSLEAEADPLLNASWSEADKPRRKRKLMLPLAACGILGALALIGLPMLKNSSEPQEAVSKVVPPPSSPKAAPASIAAAKPEPRPIAEREPAPELAIVRDPAPLPPVNVQPIKPPPPQTNTREVADARASVGSATEPTSWVDELVEVVPAPVANTSSGNPGGDPSRSAKDHPGLGAADIGDQDPDTVDPTPEVVPQSQINSEVMPETPAADPLETSMDPDPSTNSTAVAESIPVAPKPEVVTPQQPATKIEVASAPAAPTQVAAPIQIATPTPVAPDTRVAISEVSPVDVVTPPPPPFTSPWIGPRFDAQNKSAAIELASFVGPRMPEDVGPAKDDLTGHEVRKTSVPVADVLLLREGESPMRPASAKDMSGVWTQTTVPLESIGSPTKLLTPSVGKVRVVLATGEIFEGGLYAVGESCVWLDTQYGRMGLSGARVKSVVQIDSPKGTPALGTAGSQDLAGLERVRIKTPGGVFYGKIIDRGAKSTTLITDDGARLTLDSKDVELLSQSPIITLKKH